MILAHQVSGLNDGSTWDISEDGRVVDYDVPRDEVMDRVREEFGAGVEVTWWSLVDVWVDHT